MSDDAPFRSAALVEGQNIITAGVIERPAAERPTHDNVNAIA